MAKSEEEPFDPLPATEKTTFRVAPLEIRNGRKWERVNGVSRLVIHENVQHVTAGDEVLVIGRLVPIGAPTVPGQFHFQDYFRAAQTLSAIHVFHAESVTVQQRASIPSFSGIRSYLRKQLDQLLWRYVHSDYAGFASAILLGNRQQLTAEMRDDFVITGTSHLLAISGLHVGILAGIFLIAYRLGVLPRRWALLLTIGFVVFYAWLVEFRPPVTRAAILLSLFCFGRLIGRAGLEFNLLAVAGILVLVVNPSDLFALGPQLSFLAVASLILYKDWIFPLPSDDPVDRLIRNSRPLLQRWLNQIGRRCKQAVLVSGLIWLVGLPLVAANFHVVTPIALLVNPLVLLPTGIALFAGLGVCLFAPGLHRWRGFAAGSPVRV